MLAITLLALALSPIKGEAKNHGGVASIEISPVNGEVKAGESLTLRLTAKDSAGLTWDISPNAYFQINDPRGSLKNNKYLAGKIGTWNLSVTYGNFSAKTTVKVLPGNLATIIINPNSKPEIIDLGATRTFNAQGFDKMNNLLTGLLFTWSQEDDLGDINQKGVFTAKDTGEGKIIASLNGVSGFSAIKVKEKTLLPAAANTTNTNTARPTTAVNTNANDNNNSNVNGQVAGVETAAAAETTETKDECKTLAWYWWVLIMLAFFAVLILYYFLIRKSKGGWWWIFPLILIAGVVWLYYQYSCNKYGWWPWVSIIMAILISLFRPKKYFEEPKSPTF